MSTPRLCGETILILANAEWDWENRVNCHHIALRLAQDNRVLFVDTVGGRTPAPRELGKVVRRFRRIAGGVRKTSEGVTVLSPFVVPVYGTRWLGRLNAALLEWQLRRVLAQARGDCAVRPILWLFLPSLVSLVGRFNEKLVVYHCVDEHSANPRVPARRVKDSERQLLQRADIVLTTSSTLFEDKKNSNPQTFYMPNVADTRHFARARTETIACAADLQGIAHPIAGYIGNVSGYKVNFDLLASVAKLQTAWSFVLIGPVGRGDPSTDLSSLAGLKNVYLLGPRPYSELPRYVKAFDVCLIPFNQNDSTRGSLPMKFFEYLAAGKPVVATDLPTLREFREYFYPVNTRDEFCRALAMALAEDRKLTDARAALAIKYSWDARMTEIAEIIHQAVARKRLKSAAINNAT